MFLLGCLTAITMLEDVEDYIVLVLFGIIEDASLHAVSFHRPLPASSPADELHVSLTPWLSVMDLAYPRMGRTVSLKCNNGSPPKNPMRSAFISGLESRRFEMNDRVALIVFPDITDPGR